MLLNLVGTIDFSVADYAGILVIIHHFDKHHRNYSLKALLSSYVAVRYLVDGVFFSFHGLIKFSRPRN